MNSTSVALFPLAYAVDCFTYSVKLSLERNDTNHDDILDDCHTC
jgi:hypothetical protein